MSVQYVATDYMCGRIALAGESCPFSANSERVIDMRTILLCDKHVEEFDKKLNADRYARTARGKKSLANKKP